MVDRKERKLREISIVLFFIKELQEMNEDFYSVEIFNYYLCYVLWLYFDL